MKRMLTLFLLLAATTVTAQEPAPLFPFLISYDAPDNASNVAHFLSAPAGKGGFLRVKEGRFADDNGFVRLHATNLTGPANFPTHEQSDKLAARLARFGINCVRLHYFDAGYGTFKFPAIPGIFKGTSAWSDAPQLPEFDPERRDRQDYLIAALKKRGIYVNMNLHVARNPKGLDIFDPTLIALQKEYAKILMSRVNPYTGLAYADEPAIAVVEINNENALFNNYRGGMCDGMSQKYKDELSRQWNAWLKKKYASSDALVAAWEWKLKPLCDEQIPEGEFNDGTVLDKKVWKLEAEQTGAKMSVEDGRLKLSVEKAGGQYFPKLFRTVNIKKGEVYTLTFAMRRVDGPSGQLGLAVADAEMGWRSLGLFTQYRVGKDWTFLSYTFEGMDDSPEAQIQLTRFTPGTYEIGKISFMTGTSDTFEIQGSLESGTVPLVSAMRYAPTSIKRDFAAFLNDVETRYWVGMYDFLRNEVKVKQLISGTQLGYTSAEMMAKLDYVDSHSYWCHPSPVSKNWQIRNVSMANNFGCVMGLANQRVLGKPYTCSEYNHPFPNLYGAEGQPMLRVMGALQGWDGVFEYTYNHEPDFEPKNNTYFFSMIARTDVLAHIPACAAIYLRGDVREGKQTVTAGYDPEKFFDGLATSTRTGWTLGSAGFHGELSMMHRVGVSLDNQNVSHPEDFPMVPSRVLQSDTKELTWNREIPGKAFWTVNTDNTKLFSGFPEGRSVDLNGVKLAVGQTRLNWATVSLFSRNANGFGEKGKSNILLTATAYCENEGMKIVETSDTSITLSDWGNGTILCEGVPLTVTLPCAATKVKCFALDSRGDRKAEVPVSEADGCAVLQLGPQYKTIWYEIVTE
ncbi:MAG: hypothetical protein Q4D98_10795 [Planctomycetia bacterium]|nr:hypothetical protein [Planctomycetia bacterium]